MPESLDFEQMARRLLFRDGPVVWPLEPLVPVVAEELRQIWNARGATDIAKVEHELSTLMGSTAAGPYCKNLARALRGLDREPG